MGGHAMAKANSTAHARIPAVIYLRMSSDKQEASIAEQRDAVYAYAAKHGYVIVAEYIDEGISGDATNKRLQFQRMIADAASGRFKAVLCWDQDRFGRFDSIEAGRWIHPLREAGVCLDTVAQGRVDWNSFAGRMIYGMQTEAKHSFLRDLSRNVIRGHMARAKTGRWQGGPAPYGYTLVDSKLVPDPATAPILKRIFAEYADNGVSLRGLAEKLNLEGIPSPGGTTWRFMGIRRMLQHDLYVGTFTYGKNPEGKYHHANGSDIVEGPHRDKRPGHRSNEHYLTIADNHPALIDKATFAKVQATFKRRQRDTTPYKSKRQPYPLAGVCRCGHCGNSMIGMVQNYREWTHRVYVCSGYNQGGSAVCSRHYVDEAKMLNCIVGKIEAKALAPANLERLRAAMLRQLTAKRTKPATDDKQLRDRIAKLDREISQGADRLLKAPDDLHDVLVERLRAWRTERNDLQSRLDAHKPQERADVRQAETIINAAVARLETLRERLHETDLGKLRLALHDIVDRVELFFEAKPFGKRTKSELTKGVIYLQAEQFSTLYPSGSTPRYNLELSIPFSAAELQAA